MCINKSVGAYFLGLLLIFGLGKPDREPLDTAKAVSLRSRIPCDGYTAPEDDVRVQVTFSSGSGAREFVVSRFHKESCEVNVKIKCLHREKEGWDAVWSATSVQPTASGTMYLGSCYAWGSSEPAQYVLSGWYKEGAPNSKIEWRQAMVKQVSANPEVYEFSDPSGETARLQILRK